MLSFTLRPLRATCIKIVWRPHSDSARIVDKSESFCRFPFIPKVFVLKRDNYLFWGIRASAVFPHVVKGTGQFCDILLETGNSANKMYLLKVTLISAALRRTTMSDGKNILKCSRIVRSQLSSRPQFHCSNWRKNHRIAQSVDYLQEKRCQT